MLNNFTKIIVGGIEYDAAYSFTAHLEITELLNEKPGDKAHDLVDAIMQIGSQEGWRRFVQIAHILICSAEIAKRSMGMEATRVPNLSELLYATLPAEVPDMQEAVMEAVTRGLVREHNEEEVDMILAELNRNKKITKAELIMMLLNNGLTLRDADRIYPGTVFDISSIRNPAKTEDKTSGDVEE